MSNARKKLEHKKILDRWDANGKPVKPIRGADIKPGSWVTRDCLVASFAYYVKDPPVCDENGFAKEITLIRPKVKSDFVCERNKPFKEVCEFEPYNKCLDAWKNGEAREVVMIHEENGWYRDDVSNDDYCIGVCRECEKKL